MSQLPIAIYSAQQVRAIERFAIDELGIAGYVLMTRAGVAALRLLRERWPDAQRILIVCGSGNNAGDGYVLARYARQAGLDVSAIALSDPHKLTGDALAAWQDFASMGGQAIDWPVDNQDQVLAAADVIVDAIFGIGLARQLDATLCDRIRAMNSAPAPIFALDIPSGIDANTGRTWGAAIKADCTITFVGLKIGLYLGDAPDYLGELKFDSLDIARERGDKIAERIDAEWLKSVLKPRSRLSHKGSNGHVVVIGGGIGMAGAVGLTGEACLRVGAGLVTVVTHAQNVATVAMTRPELIVRSVAGIAEVQSLVERANVVAIGPGLGKDAWAMWLLEAAIASGKPIVVDADALNLLADHPQRHDHWILTPHPGEAGRLLGISSTEIQEDRLGSAQALVRRYGGVTVLKGANSLCFTAAADPAICDRGNPGMASPGMGDVLTGVIAGLLAQVGDAWTAARAGVLTHAMAGDMAAAQLGEKHGGVKVERGLIASDLFAQLPVCVNPQ